MGREMIAIVELIIGLSSRNEVVPCKGSGESRRDCRKRLLLWEGTDETVNKAWVPV